MQDLKKPPPANKVALGGGMPPAHSHWRVAPKAQSEPMARRVLKIDNVMVVNLLYNNSDSELNI